MMLRSFRVANHKSIRDEQELLLVPAYDKALPVVPVAAIFGANASGKSNLLDALGFMQAAVRMSFARWEAGSGVPRTPFKLSPDGTASDTSFTVDLLLDGTQYLYGFGCDGARINDEWLHAYPRGRKRVIFDRSVDKITFGSTVPDARSRAEFLTGLTRPNSLLLSAAAQANVDVVAPVYEWFRTGLRLVHPGMRRRLWREPDWVAATMARHPGLVDLLRVADLGITALDVDGAPTLAELRSADELQAALAEARHRWRTVAGELEHAMDYGGTDWQERIRYGEQQVAAAHEVVLAVEAQLTAVRAQGLAQRGLIFRHGERQTPLTLDDESEGTATWLHLLLHAVEILDTGGVMTIDEIDASLHPRLTARLIELFRDAGSNPKTAQLVFTSHDATLLGTSFGEDILGRDEIWFVDKDGASGASTVYPLTDFHPRAEDNRVRRYLGGSYGGVPAVFSRSLVEILRERKDGDGTR